MSSFCKNALIPTSKEEKELHKKIVELRNVGKIYKDICEELKVPIYKISFYASTDINHTWNLDDWIYGYYHKDSNIYPKVDIIIDCDEKIVNRFVKSGIPGKVIKSIK